MLEVARRRAARETPATVLRRYQRDRFTRPSHIPWRDLRRAEDALLGCLPGGVEVITLAPLAAHSALGTVSQHKVLTAIRACEVAADPTNALALEAATRRALSGASTVRLAAVQRVTRANLMPSVPGSYPHFSLLGLVTAGRTPAACGSRCPRSPSTCGSPSPTCAPPGPAGCRSRSRRCPTPAAGSPRRWVRSWPVPGPRS
ncbi:MAG TPA: hypothetical protein VF070_43575 [Streptosporangiaceae bacterium]